ncbi:hypothetical protein [Ensifer adhaerens]|uniref:hypothetical protein n=1 Tax=Ensifer adhaerens TaxID=106592 RepID=UPI00156915C8|nr:hypothetical protein [Ensifer adhaerens]
MLRNGACGVLAGPQTRCSNAASTAPLRAHETGHFSSGKLVVMPSGQAKSQKRKNPGKPGFFKPKQMFG